MALLSDIFIKILAKHFAKQEFRMVPPKLHGRVRIGLPELHGRIRMVWPKLHGRFRMVWPKFGILYWDSICSHQICTVGVFWHTLSIMQEKHWKNLFQIECSDSRRKTLYSGELSSGSAAECCPRLANNHSWTGIRRQKVLTLQHYVNNEIFQVERNQICRNRRRWHNNFAHGL